MNIKTTIMIAVAIVILLQCCIEDAPSTVEPTPIIPVVTPAPTITIPTPVPIVISIPERDIPVHASGNKKQCGNCHSYPLFDADNNPYITTETSARPTPTPTLQKSKQYGTVSFHTLIPDDYYAQDCELPTDQSMQEYLANSKWIDDYDAGGWDCSQMSAYMEYKLSNCGYNVVIRSANVEDENYGHSWILVEFKEGWLAYECTGRYWIYPNEAVARSYDPYGYVHWNPSMYDAGVQYESIYDVWEDYKWYSNGEEVFLKEYGWWI